LNQAYFQTKHIEIIESQTKSFKILTRFMPLETFKTSYTNFENIPCKLGSKNCLFLRVFVCKVCGRHTADPPEKWRTYTSGAQYSGED